MWYLNFKLGVDGGNLLTAIWKSRRWHLGISIGIDVDIGIDIAKILFCLWKFLAK